MIVPLIRFHLLVADSDSNPSDDVRKLQDTVTATRIRLAIDDSGAFGDSLPWPSRLYCSFLSLAAKVAHRRGMWTCFAWPMYIT